MKTTLEALRELEAHLVDAIDLMKAFPAILPAGGQHKLEGILRRVRTTLRKLSEKEARK